jgi:hypothetical protein
MKPKERASEVPGQGTVAPSVLVLDCLFRIGLDLQASTCSPPLLTLTIFNPLPVYSDSRTLYSIPTRYNY